MPGSRVVLVRRPPRRPATPLAGRRARVVGALVLTFVTAWVFVVARPALAAGAPVALGTAQSFAVLAGSAITNTGSTAIAGDVGTFPTPSETGFASIALVGTDHGGDAVTQRAKTDLFAAYTAVVERSPVITVAGTLGGSTMSPGVYASPSFGLAGTLTLDAKGDTGAEFIFQAGSTVIAESNSRVLLLNGADPCHVVWAVGSSATFKTASHFVGDVLAHTSITAQAGATFAGRLLAQDGAVTLDTNSIATTNCPPADARGVVTTTKAATSPTVTTQATTGAVTTPAESQTDAVASAAIAAVASAPVAPKANAPMAVATAPVDAAPPRWILSPPRASLSPPANVVSLVGSRLTSAGLMRFWLALSALGAAGCVALVATRRREKPTANRV